ncbi:MAG: hypothetical protein ABIL58_27760 [Pseudomonadota bacterium]
MKPIEDEQNLITVPCPKCGVMMGWIEGHPVDKNCNICNDRHALAVNIRCSLVSQLHRWILPNCEINTDEMLAIIEWAMEG